MKKIIIISLFFITLLEINSLDNYGVILKKVKVYNSNKIKILDKSNIVHIDKIKTSKKYLIFFVKIFIPDLKNKILKIKIEKNEKNLFIKLFDNKMEAWNYHYEIHQFKNKIEKVKNNPNINKSIKIRDEVSIKLDLNNYVYYFNDTKYLILDIIEINDNKIKFVTSSDEYWDYISYTILKLEPKLLLLSE
jgi:hypothetical protein